MAELESTLAQLDEMLKGASGDNAVAVALVRAMAVIEEKLAALRAK